MNIKIVGIGGIGSNLARFLGRYLNFLEERVLVTLVDGDKYEEKNKDRQEFLQLGNKAMTTAVVLANEFKNVSFHGIPKYITPENVEFLLEEKEIIFLAVDNHKTRKIVSEQCSKMENVTLISGGNDLTDGNIQVYIRRDGADITPPLTYLHPEIENPKDKLPTELSCEEQAKSEPQVFFANLEAAVAMCLALYGIIKKSLGYTEVYFDIVLNSRRPVNREITSPKEVR